MFKFLRDKLKDAVDLFKGSAEEPELAEEVVNSTDTPARLFQKFKKEDTKKTFIQTVKEKVTTRKIDEEKFSELFWDIELALLENNVAVEVIEKIKADLKETIVDKPIQKTEYSGVVTSALKTSIKELLSTESFDLIKKIAEHDKPYVIIFVGVNGVGKTTTIAKVANYLQKNNLKIILAAGDTWRAGSVEQLDEWAKKLKLPIVKGQYGADPASIAYDAISVAKSKKYDVVMIDTAGRQHKNINLMREMSKIIKVSKPNLKILVSESIVGNDAVEQATSFDMAIDIDGSILTKADVDERGGAVLSIAYVTKKPILFLGTGQEIDNLEKFNPEKIIERLGL